MFDIEKIAKTFDIGKKFLDSGRYKSAFTIFEALINENIQFIGQDNQLDLLIQNSMNNRGMSKCQLAKITKNIELYKEGLNDFNESIRLCMGLPDEEVSSLTAYKNMVFGRKEIEEIDWNAPEDKNFTDFFRSI